MSELVFDCLDVQPERFAAAPTLMFRLRIAETTGESIHAITLRCQIRIDPVRRRYTAPEEARLLELFGEVPRWSETLQSMLFANVSTMVMGFSGTTEVDLAVPCTYDFEVASAKYFHALESGEVPLTLLFSGTVFQKGDTGFSVSQVPWSKEAPYRMPSAVWHEMMNDYFPASTWIRLEHDTLDRLQRYRALEAIPGWDRTIERLLKEAGAE